MVWASESQLHQQPEVPQLDPNLELHRRESNYDLDSLLRLALAIPEQDLRSDRQPEFTQLDMELAFMDQAAIIGLTERLMAAVFREACLSQPVVHPTREVTHEVNLADTELSSSDQAAIIGLTSRLMARLPGG